MANPYEEYPDFIHQPLDYRFLGDLAKYRADKKERLQDKYDDFVGKLYVPALPQDKEARDNSINTYQGRLKTLVDKHHGEITSPEANAEFRQIQRDYTRDVQYGNLSVIKGNYDAYGIHSKNVQDLYEKEKGISSEKRDKIIKYSLAGYKGYKNPDGTYNTYNGITPAKDVELQTLADAAVNGWANEEVQRGGYIVWRNSYDYERC